MTFRMLLMPHKIDERCMETFLRFIQGRLHSSELANHDSGGRAGAITCVLMIRCAQVAVLWQPVQFCGSLCSFVATCAHHITRMQGDVFVQYCAPRLRKLSRFLLLQPSAWTHCEISEAHSTLHELCCCAAQPGMKHE
jgi:hypothetical protein